MSRPVRIGVQIQPQHAEYAEIRRAVAAAEEAGADVVFNWDHFFPLTEPLDGEDKICGGVMDVFVERVG